MSLSLSVSFRCTVSQHTLFRPVPVLSLYEYLCRFAKQQHPHSRAAYLATGKRMIGSWKVLGAEQWPINASHYVVCIAYIVSVF